MNIKNNVLSENKMKKIIFDYDHIISKLKKHRQIHMSKVSSQSIDTNSPAWVRVNPGPRIDTNEKSYRLCLGFKNVGCKYREEDEKKLGCLNCGYYANTAFKEVKDSTILQQFDKAIAIGKETGIQFNSIEFLNDGSFFNNEEIRHNLKIQLFKKISKMHNIGRVLVESRPKYITPETVNALSNQLRENQILEVGIGLESADDFVRETCINKGYSKAEYENTIKTLSEIRNGNKCNLSIVTYLLVKPAFITEKECIDDVINSMYYLQNLSIKYEIEIIPKLEPAAIVDGTILSLLHYSRESPHKYEPLNYWSILEILARLAISKTLKPQLEKVRVGAREDMDDIIKAPAIYADGGNIYYPFDFVIYESIQKFNQHHSFNHLFSMICEVYRVSNNKDIVEDHSFNKWLVNNHIENCAIVQCFNELELILKSKDWNSNTENEVKFMMMIYNVLDIIEGYDNNRFHLKQKIDDSVSKKSKNHLEDSISDCFHSLFPNKRIKVTVNTHNRENNNAEVFFDVKDLSRGNITSIWSKFSINEITN